MIKSIQTFCAAAHSESLISEFVVFSSVSVMQQHLLQSLIRRWKYSETLFTETYITERVRIAVSELKKDNKYKPFGRNYSERGAKR